LKIGSVRSSEKSVKFYQPARCHISEKSTVKTQFSIDFNVIFPPSRFIIIYVTCVTRITDKSRTPVIRNEVLKVKVAGRHGTQFQFVINWYKPRYGDGFAQSIKLWSHKNTLLPKHVPTNAQPIIEGHPLLDNGSVNTSRGNEYATIGQTSIVRKWTCFLFSPSRGYISVNDSDSSSSPVWRRGQIPPL
jgi:hypothetical protein